MLKLVWISARKVGEPFPHSELPSNGLHGVTVIMWVVSILFIPHTCTHPILQQVNVIGSILCRVMKRSGEITLIHENCRRNISRSKVYEDVHLPFHSSQVAEQKAVVIFCHAHTTFCASVCKYRSRFRFLASTPEHSSMGMRFLERQWKLLSCYCLCRGLTPSGN